MAESLRQWYLSTFADGQHLEGKALRLHILQTLINIPTEAE